MPSFATALDTQAKAVLFTSLIATLFAIASYSSMGGANLAPSWVTVPDVEGISRKAVPYSAAAYASCAVFSAAAFYYLLLALATSWVLAEAQAYDRDIGLKTFTVVRVAFYSGMLLLQAGVGLWAWALATASKLLSALVGPSPGALFIIPCVAAMIGLFIFGYMAWGCCPPAKQRTPLI